MKIEQLIVAGDPAIIDLTVLAQLLGYNQAKLRKFAFKFLETTEDGLAEIERAIAAGELARVRDLGHRIKSPARTVGALGLAALCQQLEELSAHEPERQLQLAQACIVQMWPLLHQISEHILHNLQLTARPDT